MRGDEQMEELIDAALRSYAEPGEIPEARVVAARVMEQAGGGEPEEILVVGGGGCGSGLFAGCDGGGGLDDAGGAGSGDCVGTEGAGGGEGG